MEVTVHRERGAVEVTVLQPHGEIDALSYGELIASAEAAVGAGATDLLLDLSAVSYMSSSGLMALHRIATMVRDQNAPEAASGSGARPTAPPDVEPGAEAHIKLLRPQPEVEWVLTRAGFDPFLDIHTDLLTAVHSF